MNRKHRGFTLIEVLVALIILSVGLLGLAALQTRANQAEVESYQRAQAMLLANDIADRIRANSSVPECYGITLDAAAGTPFVGAGNVDVFNCAGWGILETRGIADNDIAQWEQQLLGAGETITGTGNSVGAMLAARGCLYYNAAARTATIVVAWQGLTPNTYLDDDNNGVPDCRENGRIDCSCANDSYNNNGNDYKRSLSIPVQLADLD